MLRVVTGDEGRAEMCAALDEIVLQGAQRMLAAALEAEVDAYIAGLVKRLDEDAGAWSRVTATPSPHHHHRRWADRGASSSG
ncbi:MAG: IS256 family transposase, partial [Actinomycetota bacterium]|nr:IS256 family transposase [Actinomycetota bacterium]